MNNLIDCQERYKFMENPEAYLTDLHGWWRKTRLEMMPKKRWYQTRKSYEKQLALIREEIELKYKEMMKNVKKDAAEMSKPTYVYYRGNKLAVPNEFYFNYDTADCAGYLLYLRKQDEAKNIITEEDREKARLLNCDLDYVYLQELMNKMSLNADLVITIKTKDNSVITLRTNKKEENTDFSNEMFIQQDYVK